VVVVAFKFNVLPLHTGLLLVTVGFAGVALMVTGRDAAIDVHPLTVTETV
jgi:hypothetical protein